MTEIKLLPSFPADLMHMRKILTLFYTGLILPVMTLAQDSSPLEGLSDVREQLTIIRNVDVTTEPGKTIRAAELRIQKGKVVSVGTPAALPPGAVVIDGGGMHVYPAFIELCSDYGMPEASATSGGSGRREASRNTPVRATSSYWNRAIHPEFSAASVFQPDGKRADELRKAGFGAALTVVRDGIVRGSAAVVLLGDGQATLQIVRAEAMMGMSFDKGSSGQDYPSSLMGSIALLRQSMLDRNWYGQPNLVHDFNVSLEAMHAKRNLPVVFDVSDYRSALRAVRVAKEFDLKLVIKGSGDEYKRADELAATGASFILPLQFPKAYDVSDPFDALNITLADMKHWEAAPANAAIMALQKSAVFAFTSDGLKDRKEMLAALRKVARYGLDTNRILSALTTVPARLAGVEDKLGALRPGMVASFILCTKPLLDKECVIAESWISGKRYVLKEADTLEIAGRFALQLDTLKGYTMQVSADRTAPKFTLKKDTIEIGVEASQNGLQWTLRVELQKRKGAYRLNGMYDATTNRWSGIGQDPAGRWISWFATRDGAASVPKPTAKDSVVRDSAVQLPSVWWPQTAFGWDNAIQTIPTQATVCFRNATVWTCESQGKLMQADVLVRDGKISKVGALSPDELKGVRVIDCTGKHITPGIIDEHSHIAINQGVNEGTQSITSEVRIGDVIDPDDIDIYRQLAGGVTTSHLLHGSANAIGGQTALIKLRWGRSAEALKFEGAPPFIKFALGENVKQTNWGDNNVSRYPQTRMGVEQLYIDAFSRARAYERSWKDFAAGTTKSAPRKDLELEALMEILNSKRFITCHSYQQGEINMLMHVADTFGFRVNTFTHILEGYKVADKMKRHGAGGSSFADWWAYKYEVIDAIPYNGALMHRCGVLTAFNSDDSEMARRLNQEAAKAVKYGGLSEEEALCFVTLNPAKLLRIDQRVGSIKAGKDADLVVWNGHPLSVGSRPVQTYVDGICYFDIVRDEELRKRNESERQRLIRKMSDDKQQGGASQRPTTTLREEFHCNDMEHLPH
jgi:imidazolonepropionase-like amidohydrolase